MNEFIFITVFIVVVVWSLIRIINSGKEQGDYNRGGAGRYNRGDSADSENSPQKHSGRWPLWFGRRKKKEYRFSSPLDWRLYRYDREAIKTCAGLLAVEVSELKEILVDIPVHYKSFKLRKRSGGFRVISAPEGKLLSVQQVIYSRILQFATIHPAATGFRQGKSIVDNVRPHLGKKTILKTDLRDFFGSTPLFKVKRAFLQIGYPEPIVEVLAQLCCLRKRLPQGAPTSPALSNIIAYSMDTRLLRLAQRYGLTYSRYADDLTFSGESIPREDFLSKLNTIVIKEGYALSVKKTRFIGENRRKIITGISISSGQKLTIPKAKKREIRKNVHFILTRGVDAHQRHIGSTDPAYLKRLVGYLHYWQSVEPDNQYVSDSLNALKRVSK